MKSIRKRSIFLICVVSAENSLFGAVTVSGPGICQQNTTCAYTASGGIGPYTYSLASGSAGSINANTGVYTAPPHITPAQTYGGCQVHPNNHIFNTRIDGLPVHASNAVWMSNLVLGTVKVSYETGFLGNPGVTASHPKTAMSFAYTPSANGNFVIPSPYDLRMEGGSMSYNVPGLDRHAIITTKDTCDEYEIYNLYPTGFYNDVASSNSRSGANYSLPSLAISPTGTDAAQLELLPLTLRPSELIAGAVNHALRMTFSVVGINTSANIWPAQSNNGYAVCQGGTATNCAPYGARIRLKASYSWPGFDGLCTTSNCHRYLQSLLTQLKQYGVVVSDIGTQGAISAMVESPNPDVRAAFAEVRNNLVMDATNFEIVDESSLNTNRSGTGASSSWGEAKYNNAAGVMPSGFAVVIATDRFSVSGQASISLQGVAIGVVRPTEVIQAGSDPKQLSAWVTGASDTTVTWSLDSSEGNNGTITTGGLYSAPTLVPGRVVTSVTARSNADATVFATVSLIILPGGVLRINTGDTADYTDGDGNIWFADELIDSPPMFDNGKPLALGSLPWANAGKSPRVYDNVMWNGLCDVMFHLTVANGTYLVGLRFTNIAGSANIQQGSIDSQGTEKVARFDPYVITGTKNSTFTLNIFVSVSDGSLDVNVRNIGADHEYSDPSTSGWLYPLESSLGVNPMVSGFTVTPCPSSRSIRERMNIPEPSAGLQRTCQLTSMW
jgi:hypothetical protein